MAIPAILLLLAIAVSRAESQELKVDVLNTTILKIGSEVTIKPTELHSNKAKSCKSTKTGNQCSRIHYRTIDGSCNNLKHPKWGTPNRPYARLLPNKFCNVSRCGSTLPNPRMTSRLLFPNNEVEDDLWTINTMLWGQMLTHDMSLTAGVPQGVSAPFACCEDGKFTNEILTNPQCAPIVIPPNDPSHPSEQCMEFIRTATSLTESPGNTSTQAPKVPLSSVNAYMDMSMIYGLNDSQATYLRSGFCGRLGTVKRHGQEWPMQDKNAKDSCFVNSADEPCYYTGDVRGNQNSLLSVLQVIFLRLHNIIADEFCCMNPHWNDEKVYQESRRLLIGMVQHIHYSEYLPALHGEDNMVKHKLIHPKAKGYVEDYDPTVDPSTLDIHATAAFRYFHTGIVGTLTKITENFEATGILRFSDSMLKPSVIEINDTFAELSRTMCTQRHSAADQYYDAEITERMFRGPKPFGKDLRALDIQRGRDHCLPSYNDVRQLCGLPRAEKFSDFSDYIPEPIIEKLSKIYGCVDDVELVVAGSLERIVPDTQFGPTYLCISMEQFRRSRIGDRFFYESGRNPSSFTLDQLNSIRKGSTLSRIYCDCVPGIKSIQPKAFEIISKDNQRVPCDQIPRVNMRLWKECK